MKRIADDSVRIVAHIIPNPAAILQSACSRLRSVLNAKQASVTSESLHTPPSQDLEKLPAVVDNVGVPSKGKPSEPIPAPMVQTSVISKCHNIIFSTRTRERASARTLSIVRSLLGSESISTKLMHTKRLQQHLLEHPDVADIARQGGAVRFLRSAIRKSPDYAFRAEVHSCLALLGCVPPLKGVGIRILSIDGGGTRGMMALEVLEALQQSCGGRRVSELFDYVIGVSTGAIIASLVTGLNLTVNECKQIYREISSKLFDQSRVWGTTGLLLSHSYYDTKLWVKVLRQAIGEKHFLETAGDPSFPRLAFVSAIVNQPTAEVFLFRNYHLPPVHPSIYRGSCKYKIWQAVQCSGAAPGYFEEVILDDFVHQDGGVLFNNPTSISLHEAKLLWPGAKFDCVVSLGNGRPPAFTEFGRQPKPNAVASSLAEKVTTIVDSATDTEKVHTVIADLLPPSTYFRFNPYMSHKYTLDECSPERLAQISEDAKLYIRKNAQKLGIVAEKLVTPKPRNERLKVWLGEKFPDYVSSDV